MNIKYYILAAGKLNETPEYYEDAYYPNEMMGYIEIYLLSENDTDTPPMDIIRLSVADGATTGSYCGDWAKTLVETFGSSDDAFNPEFFYRQCLDKWNNFSKDILENSTDPFDSSALYETGAFSTFLGFEIDHKGNWRAYAVGDSTLFHIRDERIIRSFILQSSEEYGLTTQGFSSLRNFSKAPWEQIQTICGELKDNDVIYLMTDALSKWFFEEFEENRLPWETLNNYGKNGNIEAFKTWVAEQQQSGDLENDDITVICITIQENSDGLAYTG